MRRIRLKPLVHAWVGLVLLPVVASAQSVEQEVRDAAASFVDAFNDLDWERFSASWAEDATAFFPPGIEANRVEGKAAIVAQFQAAFEDFPTEASDPPYLSIEPQALGVTMLNGTAVVTFHLGDSLTPSRRTLVFVTRDGGWLIAHLHASSSS
jgi:ketosteroid isomerase-like protein